MGGTIELDEYCRVVAEEPNDNIHLFPTCRNGDCSIYLGEFVEEKEGEFHLTDAELDRVTSNGFLHIGDRNTTYIDFIDIKYLTYESGHMGVFINAHHPQVSFLYFTSNMIASRH